MMLKWSLALLVALSLSVLAGAIQVFNQAWNESAAESVRQSRVALQLAQQRSGLLEMAEREGLLSSFEQDRGSFNVELALGIENISRHGENLSLQFEQETVGTIDYPDSELEIGVIALNVRFRASHAPAALDVIKKVDEKIGAWPAEVRGCELFRTPVNSLSVSCVFHIYHWAVDDRPVA